MAKAKEFDKSIEEIKKKVQLNDGQKIQVLGRKKSGMSHDEAVQFVLSKSNRQGRSDKAIEIREKNKSKFLKREKDAKPSDKKLAYLESLNKNKNILEE